MALGKEGEPFTILDDPFAQLAGGVGIMAGYQPHQSFKVIQKRVLENYLEVHSSNRERI